MYFVIKQVTKFCSVWTFHDFDEISTDQIADNITLDFLHLYARFLFIYVCIVTE